MRKLLGAAKRQVDRFANTLLKLTMAQRSSKSLANRCFRASPVEGSQVKGDVRILRVAANLS